MGPRTTGGTFMDALERGHIIGVIGSNDASGLPGRWGRGRAGVWAKDCTRQSIWDAFTKRRTYAVTGDRIILDFEIEGTPMGGITRGGSSVDVSVSVTGSHAIDRIELIQDGIVADTYCHSGKWEKHARNNKRFKFFCEAGWGPSNRYVSEQWGDPPAGGYSTQNHWLCNLKVKNGNIADVERCFSVQGQKVSRSGKDYCQWILKPKKRGTTIFPESRQGMVFEIEGNPETGLFFDMEGKKFHITLKELLKKSLLVPFLKETEKNIMNSFGISRTMIENPDIIFHNSRKVKIHRAIPESAYKVEHTFKKIKCGKKRSYFYLRVFQLNGQMAWSSPIWVDKKK
jgi:hypothetical protein